MGLHHQANHGRVLRGNEARAALENQKRDSHGNSIKMNVPAYLKAAARPADPAQTNYANKVEEKVATVYSVVFETVSAGFTGPTAGYTTLSDAPQTPTSVAQSTAAASSSVNDAEASYFSAKSAASARISSSSTATADSSTITASTSSLPEGHNNKSVFLNPPTTATSAVAASTVAVGVAGGPPQNTRASVVGGTPLSATRTPNEIALHNNGLSGGAKAGLAIGILLALGLAAGLLFFCWRRRKNDKHEELIDEKHASSVFGGRSISEKHSSYAPSARSTRTASTAPRLSLRPVTQFLPNLGENRKSTGNALDAAAISSAPKSMWERRANATENPFADAAVMSEKQARPESPPSNPFDEPEAHADGQKSPSYKSAHSGNHSQKSSWEGSEPATPKSTKFGTAAAVPIAAAGSANAAPPVPRGPNNVHRVQLDFKPSMDDELELVSGQLVRMLHEYDDGWALCITMDRSKQGVTPRTCLSKLPVKPRPQGPPPNAQNGRPMSPMGPPGMYPRPLTPTGRSRSNSAAGLERPQTPTGNVPARKPVPGQAL